MPVLFGEPGAESTPGNIAKVMPQVCVRESSRPSPAAHDPPVIVWLRALARHAHDECGGPGVGAVGMCFTGGFALAMMTEPALLAPVLANRRCPSPSPDPELRTWVARMSTCSR